MDTNDYDETADVEGEESDGREAAHFLDGEDVIGEDGLGHNLDQIYEGDAGVEGCVKSDQECSVSTESPGESYIGSAEGLMLSRVRRGASGSEQDGRHKPRKAKGRVNKR